MIDEVEEWRAVVGWEGLYEVSSLGRVRSLDRLNTYLRKGVAVFRPLKGRILQPHTDRDGYPQVSLSDARARNRAASARVHQLVARAFLGECPDGFQPAHLDGKPASNNISNLQFVSAVENQGHRLLHGTDQRGVKSAVHKLSVADVLEIRRLGRTVRHKVLAARFGVCRGHISSIVNGRARPFD